MKHKAANTPHVDEIFGIVDDVLDRVERDGRIHRVRKPKQVLPKLQVRRSEVTDEMKKVDLGNVVYVPEPVLQALTASLNKQTDNTNKLLLQHLMPLLLSYQTSTNYARAALKEGLDIEVDFDPGLASCITSIGYLNVVMHYIRKSKIPVSVKRRFMAKFSDGLAAQSVTGMVEENKLQTKKLLQEHLQAVVYSRQKGKAELVERRNEEEVKSPLPKRKLQTKTSDAVPSGVRRSRRA